MNEIILNSREQEIKSEDSVVTSSNEELINHNDDEKYIESIEISSEEKENNNSSSQAVTSQVYQSQSSTSSSSLPPKSPLAAVATNTIKLDEPENDLGEEEIIDGFAILTFKDIKDLKREYENRKRKQHNNDKFTTLISSSSSSSSSSANDNSSVISSSSSSTSSANRRKCVKTKDNSSPSLLINKNNKAASTSSKSKEISDNNKENLKDLQLKTENESAKKQSESPNIELNNKVIEIDVDNDPITQNEEVENSKTNIQDQELSKSHSVTSMLKNDKTIVNNEASCSSSNARSSPLFNLNSIYSQHPTSSLFPSLTKQQAPPSSDSLFNFNKLILDFYQNGQQPNNEVSNKSQLITPSPLVQSHSNTDLYSNIIKSNSQQPPFLLSPKSKQKNDNNQASLSSNYKSTTNQHQISSASTNNNNSKSSSSSSKNSHRHHHHSHHQQHHSHYQNASLQQISNSTSLAGFPANFNTTLDVATTQSLGKLESLSNNHHHHHDRLYVNSNSNNNVNKQQKQIHQKQANNHISDDFNETFLQVSNTLKAIKNPSSVPSSSLNILSSIQQQDNLAAQLLNNYHLSQFNEAQQKQLEINNSKIPTKNHNKQQQQQQQNNMYATASTKSSSSSSSHPFDSYSPDLLQHELNSRFLHKQSVNRMTPNNNNNNNNNLVTQPPPAAASSLFNPALRPYLTNSNDVVMYPTESIFNPLNDIGKPNKNDHLSQYFKQNIMMPPPPTTPIMPPFGTTTLPTKHQQVTSSVRSSQNNVPISPFMNPSTMQAATLLNNSKLIQLNDALSSTQQKQRRGKWCTAHVKIAHMIQNSEKQCNINTKQHQKDVDMKMIESKKVIVANNLGQQHFNNPTFIPSIHKNNHFDAINQHAAYLQNNMINDVLHKLPMQQHSASFSGLSSIGSNVPIPITNMLEASERKEEKKQRHSHNNLNSQNNLIHHNRHHSDINNEIHRSKQDKNISQHHAHHFHRESGHHNKQQKLNRSRSRSPLNRHSAAISNKGEIQININNQNLISPNSARNSNPANITMNSSYNEKYRQEIFNLNQNNTLPIPSSMSNPASRFLLDSPDGKILSKTKEANERQHHSTTIHNNFPFLPSQMQNSIVPTNLLNNEASYRLQSLMPHDDRESRESILRAGGFNFTPSPIYFDPVNSKLSQPQFSHYTPYQSLNFPQFPTIANYDQLNLNNLTSNKHDSKQTNALSSSMQPIHSMNHQSLITSGNYIPPHLNSNNNNNNHSNSSIKKSNLISPAKSKYATTTATPTMHLNYDSMLIKKPPSLIDNNNDVIIINDNNEQSKFSNKHEKRYTNHHHQAQEDILNISANASVYANNNHNAVPPSNAFTQKI